MKPKISKSSLKKLEQKSKLNNHVKSKNRFNFEPVFLYSILIYINYRNNNTSKNGNMLLFFSQ